MPRLLYLFALCNLVLGTGAFVISGVLVPISDDLQVSVAAAGQAMTVYALSTAVLAPIALVLTGAWPRRRALWFGMGVFALGNLVCALAPSLPVLLAGRAVMGVGAMFTPVAAGIAVALVEPARRGRALALVFVGISLSYVIGLPLGAWLGFRHGWHWPVGLVAVLAGLSSVALAALLPRDIAAPGASFKGLAPLLARPAVLWTLSLTLLYFVAIFIVFSYIGPVLQALYPMSTERLSVTLMLFGLSGAVGTVIGGWANDRFGPETFARRAVVTAGLHDGAGAADPRALRTAGAGLRRLGHRGLRHDDAAAVAPGDDRAGAGADPALAEHLDALRRHGDGRGDRRGGRGQRRVRPPGLGRRAVRARRHGQPVDQCPKDGPSQTGVSARRS